MNAFAWGLVWTSAAIALFGQDPSSTAKPEYYDEPKFIVAGVADPSLRGGHGSDPGSHSADALAKATAALRSSDSVSAGEDSLRQAIARAPNRADLHHSLAAAEERLGNALEAVREYQRAAELEPSEANLFDWGAELLAHRAADQAIEVFANANGLFPSSTRTMLGLAVAYYSRGSYDQAARWFFQATDLDPRDPAPYLFLGKVSSGAITGSAGFAERLERFARLHPENAWANYYNAASLLSRREDLVKAQRLLEKAVRLDPHLGVAYLELGKLFAERDDLVKAIAAYQKAIDAGPPMEEAHYRLAQAYRKTGESAKAQKEIELYQQLQKQSVEESERERAAIQQFVFELKH